MTKEAEETLNRLEVVSLARLAHAMLEQRGGVQDAVALLHLQQAIELLDTILVEQRHRQIKPH